MELSPSLVRCWMTEPGRADTTVTGHEVYQTGSYEVTSLPGLDFQPDDKLPDSADESNSGQDRELRNVSLLASQTPPRSSLLFSLFA